MNLLNQVEKLNENTNLFDEKFKSLNCDYHFESKKEVYDFIKQHPGLLLIIEKYTPYLKEHFPNGVFELEINTDPEIIDWKTLMLLVKVDKNTYENGCYEYLTNLRRQFRPLRKELNLMSEIIVTSRVLR